MKKTIRLTESDLINIIESVLNEKRIPASELIKDMTIRDIVDVVNYFSNKQISVKEVKEKIEYMFRPNGGRLNEDMSENTLYSDIMGMIRNSNSSHEEIVSILRSIADEMESSRRVKRDAVSRFRDYRLSESEDIYTDSREDFQFDIKSVECGDDTFSSGHVDIDEDDVIVIRYCEDNRESLERLKRKGERLLRSKYGM